MFSWDISRRLVSSSLFKPPTPAPAVLPMMSRKLRSSKISMGRFLTSQALLPELAEASQSARSDMVLAWQATYESPDIIYYRLDEIAIAGECDSHRCKSLNGKNHWLHCGFHLSNSRKLHVSKTHWNLLRSNFSYFIETIILFIRALFFELGCGPCIHISTLNILVPIRKRWQPPGSLVPLFLPTIHTSRSQKSSRVRPQNLLRFLLNLRMRLSRKPSQKHHYGLTPHPLLLLPPAALKNRY